MTRTTSLRVVPLSGLTAKDRIADLMSQVAVIGEEQAHELIVALEDVLRCAAELEENPAAKVGPRDVARKLRRDFEPILTTLKTMEARA